MEKTYSYDISRVPPTVMKYYIPQIVSSILNGTEMPVSNDPEVNRFIHDFYNAYMYIMMHGTSLPYVQAC